MSDFRFYCPECSQKIVCDTEYIGRQITCPTCQKTLTVPSEAAMAPVAAGSAAGFTGAGNAAPAFSATHPSVPSPVPSSAGAPKAAQPDPNRYSALAIASLLCSVFVVLGFIPGLICGHLAKARMRKDVFLEGERIANAGLVISYCVLIVFLLCGAGVLGVRWYYHPVREMLASGDAALGADYRIVDQVRIDQTDDDSQEEDHDLARRNSQTTTTGDIKGRRATRGGSFGYTMKVLPDEPMSLGCEYWGSESKGRVFDIAIDGRVIATQRLGHNLPGKFFEEEYKIPRALTRGKTEVTVEFQAHPLVTAGTLYGCAMLKR